MCDVAPSMPVGWLPLVRGGPCGVVEESTVITVADGGDRVAVVECPGESILLVLVAGVAGC